RVLSSRAVNTASVSVSDFDNAIRPVASGPQLTFPSLQDGSSFRVPQSTVQRRVQVANTLSLAAGSHFIRIGGEVQRVDAGFGLGVFREGRIEFVQDFPQFDHNGDGVVDDNDLLFAVTLRSGKPDRDLDISDADNVHVAGFVQDDWRVSSRLTVNVGLRYELDTDAKNNSRYDRINPLVAPFLRGTRTRDTNNWAPRVGFNWTMADGRTSVRGGYGIYYDRITLQIQSLERGPRRAGAADRGARRQRLLPRRDDGPVPAVRAEPGQPAHRVRAARRGRLGHQHHRQRHAESDDAAVQSRHRAAARAELDRPRRRPACARHALHHRTYH